MEEKTWDSAAAATGSGLDLAIVIATTAVTLRLQPAFGWWLRGGRRRENRITMTEKLTELRLAAAIRGNASLCE
nr:3-epi-6-deoxocathasterone 23-monooxygenase [Ipomoea trifida]